MTRLGTYDLHFIGRGKNRPYGTMMNATAACGNEWVQKIVEYLNNDQLDLVAADAWYHISCQRKLYQKSQ